MPLHYLKINTEIDFHKAHTAKDKITDNRVEAVILRGKVNMHLPVEEKVNPKKKGGDMKKVETPVL